MKTFDDVDMTTEEVEHVNVDRFAFQKQRLLFNVTRSKEVCIALEKWLMSFDGGMSKQTFVSQVARLDSDDEVAVGQIEKSIGKRSIVKRKVVSEPLPRADKAVNMLADGTLFIAVAGRELNIRKYIRETYQTLRTLGDTFVLDMNELRLEWVDKYKKGRGEEILRKAKEAEFLIIVGFEAPMDLPNFILDWVNSLRRYRIDKKMPVISTFARFREKEFFFNEFVKCAV